MRMSSVLTYFTIVSLIVRYGFPEYGLCVCVPVEVLHSGSHNRSCVSSSHQSSHKAFRCYLPKTFRTLGILSGNICVSELPGRGYEALTKYVRGAVLVVRESVLVVMQGLVSLVR